MQQAGRHLLEMISCVLDLSEIEAGHVTVRPAALNVKDLAAAALDLVRPAAEEKGLWLELVVDDGVSPVLTTDPTRLRQILLNLLGNAVKFTATGHIQLRLHLAPQPLALRIDVVDTGPGIPERHRDRLFQHFDRLDAQDSRAIEGAGLGLAVSSRFATLLGGELCYLPNPAGGSIFRLDLPALDGPAVADSALIAGNTVAPDGPRQPSRPLHVLIADDVEMNREIAASFLASVGHTTVCVADGESAAAAAAENDFDIVLMDVRMPGIDGLEATRRIRALPAPRSQVTIIALTAQAFSDQIAACNQAGMDGHLGKPFSPDALIAAVETAASRARQSPIPLAEPEGCLFDRHAFDEAAELLQPGVVAKHLNELLDRCGTLAADLATAAQTRDGSPALADQAHQLAGTAGILGFERLATACRRFEYACSSSTGDSSAIEHSLPEILATSRAEMRSLKTEMTSV